MKPRHWTIAFFSLLVLIGAMGALSALLNGHHAFHTTDLWPWGLLISTYAFLALSASGLCMISSLGHFGLKSFEIISKRAIFLAIISLSAGMGVIGLELGNPFNLFWVFLSPNPESAIWWMSALYSTYLVLLLAEFYFLLKENHRWAKLSGTLAFINALGASSTVGAVFGFQHSRPFWEGPYPPLFFILTAFLSGTVILILLYFILGKVRGKQEAKETQRILPLLRNLLTLLLGVTLLASIWKLLMGIYGYSPGLTEAQQALNYGPLSFNYWVLEWGFGMIIPFALILTSKNSINRLVWAAALSLIGIFFMRYNLVAAGQIVPLSALEGSTAVGFRSYIPSPTEIAIVLGAIGATVLAYMAGEWKLNLGNQRPPTLDR